MQVNVQDAKSSLSRLLVAVENGQSVVIARSGTPIARLVSMDQSMRELGFMPLVGPGSDEALAPLGDEEAELWYSSNVFP